MSGNKSRLFVSGSWSALESGLRATIREIKAQDPLKPVLVLVGSNLLAQHLERTLCLELNREGLGLNLRFLLFPDLVEKLYYTSPFPQYRPPAGHLFRLLMMKNLLAELPPNHYFAPLRDSSGLAESLVAEHRDLKDGLVSGANFEKARASLAGRKVQGKIAALFNILEEFDHRLQGYEGEWERFELAAQRADRFHQVFGTDRLLVYGFYDYTALQMELVRRIAQSAVVEFFMVRPDNRMFSEYAERVWEFYTKELRLEPEQLEPEKHQSDLALFQASLETGPREKPRFDGSVSVVFAPGIEREVLEVCREIFRLVRCRGLRFEEIGVLVRDHGSYRRALEEAFALYGIPFYQAGGRPLSEFASIRALFRLLRILEADYSRSSVIAFLMSQALAGQVLGDNGKEQLGLFDLVSREAFIVRGREQWAKRLKDYAEALQQKAEAEKDEDQEQRVQKPWTIKIKAAQNLAEISARLFAGLEKLRTGRGLKNLSGLLKDLAHEYIDFADEPLASPSGSESFVRQKLDDILDELTQLDDICPGADCRIFFELLEKELAANTLRTGSFRQGGVCLSELMNARGVSFKAVIIPGLCEGSFPLGLSESPLLTDAERAKLNHVLDGRGYLAEKWRLLEEERLLFYLTANQALDSLVLCASYLDLEANCEKPVSYLLGMALEKFLMQEIELGRIRSLSHNFPLVRSVELGDFAPASGELALGPDDFENREIELAESPEAYAHLLWSETIQQQARLALERWLETRPGAFGGVIGGFADYKREDLSTISPSRLAEYLGCPFAYWMSRILKIAPLEEPEQVREFEPKGKGELVHRALHSLLQEIMKNNLGQDQSQALKKLAEFLENRGREYLREEYQAQEELIANELDNIYFYLANIYQQLLPAPECRKVLSEEKIDSQKVELEFEPGRKVRLAGLIDRVDMEGTDVKVIDYKVAGSGESFRKDPLRQLQLPIYLFSVVNMFGLNPESASAGFLLMNLKPFALPEKSLLITGKNFPKHLQALRQLVKIMIDGIESGVFAPAQQKCDYCDYAQTCFATTASFRPKLRTGWLQELLATIDRCNFLKIENEK